MLTTITATVKNMKNQTIFDQGLNKNPANYVPLSPLSFLTRTADVFPHHTALIYGEHRQSWASTAKRCRRLANALKKRGTGHGDTVTIMAPNTPPLFEAHFAVPLCGAVLNPLNIRLDATAIAFILEHAETKVFIFDREFSDIVKEALSKLETPPTTIHIDDSLAESGELIGELDYEDLIAEGEVDFDYQLPQDEWDAIALNYTSGTTGNPKGVVYHHRGAYLNSIGNMVSWQMPKHPVYLWTLPMFHCNGWCFPWSITALAGTNICLRKVEPEAIFNAIEKHQVTHFCGAPIVMGMMVNWHGAKQVSSPIKMMTAGAAPPAAILERMEKLNIDVTHVYGLTEVYGPTTLCDWQHQWDQLPADARATQKARQGVRYITQQDFFVANPDTLKPVPNDGETIGELVFRGNAVMKGYLKNPVATKESLAGGYFRSGDLGVMHPDGYVEICDRSKDIIISGGENISSIEIENVLYQHDAIAEAAVVAKTDAKWGETPCAFVSLREGKSATAEEIIAFCRERLAHFKCPKTVMFEALPKTSTGKIQKFILRERAENL